MKSELSFSEFKEVHREEWIDKIKKDLKGKPIEDLNFKLENDIEIDPFVLESKENDISFHGSFERRQDFYLLSNSNILEALNNGVESIGLFQNDLKGNVKTCLKGVRTEYISVHFSNTNSSVEILDEFLLCGIADSIRGSFALNPFIDLWSRKSKLDQSDFLVQIDKFHKSLPNFKLIEIDTSYIENQGATVIDQVGYSISQAHEYLNILLDSGYDIATAANLLHFKLSIGTGYFSELTKIRALRTIWSKILMDYGLTREKLNKCIYINAETSFLQHSQMDENNNLLRSTTIGMSSLLAGVNSLSMIPLDFSKNTESEKSLRYARNIQNLLIEESHLAFVNDPGKGSYIIEEMTSEICKKAWSIFENTEKNGGFQNLDHSHLINDFNTKRRLIQEEYTKGEKVLLGVNKYPSKDIQKLKESKDKRFRISKEWEEKL